MTGRPALPLHTRVVASPDQVSADLEGEAVILGMRDGIYYGLDGVGATIWALVQEGSTIAALVERIIADYEVTAEVATADLLVLLHDLHARGLVTLDPAPEAAAPDAP